SFGGWFKPPRQPRTPLEKFNSWRRRIRSELLDLVRLQFTPEHRAQIRASRLEGEQKAQAEARLHAIQASKKITGDVYANIPLVNPQRVVRVWRYDVPLGKLNAWEPHPIPVKLDQSGVYLLEATDAHRQAQVILIASPMVLLARGEHGKLDIRALDATTGEPRPDASVILLDTHAKQRIGEATTGPDGLASFPLANPDLTEFLALAQRGADFAALSVGGWSIRPDPGNLQGAVYTDRPVYRPGHEVQFKAIIRKKIAGTFVLPDERDARITVTNPEGRTVLQKTGTLSDFGTLSSNLKLPESAATGGYGINVQIGEQGVFGNFTVQEYRKPEYEVRLAAATPRVLQGNSQRITLDARYYYGEPVRAGVVEWHVYRTGWYPPWHAEEFSGEGEVEGEGESEFRGQEVSTHKGSLGPNGKAFLDLPTALDQMDRTYTVEAQVTDASGRPVAGRTSFLATVGPFYARVQPTRYFFAPHTSAALRITTTGFDGNPFPNVSFTADIVLHEYHPPVATMLGLNPGRGTSTTRTVLTVQGRTGADGQGEVAFTAPESGSYSVELHANAPSGRIVRGTSWFYTSGAGGNWGEQEGVIRITPDKRSYKPGETARLLIITGAPGAWVWVSIESQAVYWSQWIHMRDAAETVEVPIRPEWTPNVFAQAVMIRNGRFWRGQKIIKVPPDHRTLAVKVTPAKTEFRPGEPAAYDLEARDPAGHPVQAELSLGVVDEAIYAIERDPLPNLVKAFYDRDWDQVFSASSLQWTFFASSGHKSLKLAGLRPQRPFGQLKPERPPAPKIRKNFPDTAYWIANLRTGADGHGRVQFEFPDSLTTWRATARGITQDTLVGSAVNKVLVRKRLILSFASPRFAVEGDQLTVPVIVRNFLNQPQHVLLTLQAAGADVLSSAPGVFEIEPNGEARFDWRLKAQAAREIKLTGTAVAQGESDGLEITLPVEPWGLPWRSGVSAALSGGPSSTNDERSLNLLIPDAARPATRHVTLSVAPSIAASMLGSLEFLTNYPYGCTEQTLSSFLPNLVVRGAMKELGAGSVNGAALENIGRVDDAALEKMIRAGVKRILDFQNKQGGWGFWREDETDPFLTAYAVWALSLEASLRAANVPYPALQGADLLSNMSTDEDNDRPDLVAWRLHAIEFARGANPQEIGRVWDVRHDLSPQGLALLGIVFLRHNDDRAAEIASRLEGLVKKDNQGARWISKRDLFEPWLRDVDVESTAFVLRFLSRQNPSNPLLPEAARWLAASRDNGPAWNTTKRTAFALYGLTEYLKVSKELQPSFKLTVRAAGKTVFEQSFSSSDVFAPPAHAEVPAGVPVEIRKEGSGVAYVSLEGTARLAGDHLEMPSAGSGFQIARELYRLVPQTLNGRIVQHLEPLSGPVHIGETVLLRLTVSALKDQRYLVIDSPLPAGAEPIEHDGVYELSPQPPWWTLSWARRDLRDNQAVWYPWRIYGWAWGDYGIDRAGVYSALIRFTNPGTYRLGAARVEAMYQPGLFRATEQLTLEVVQP
ncbi:MAG: MG2 domain-containing protein, partial [Bryobacteraceae bacterium]